jgi:hypothetical protein
MRPILMLALFLGLTACTSAICSDLEPDGGIGGTGGCTNEMPEQVAYAQISEISGQGLDLLLVTDAAES